MRSKYFGPSFQLFLNIQRLVVSWLTDHGDKAKVTICYWNKPFIKVETNKCPGGCNLQASDLAFILQNVARELFYHAHCDIKNLFHKCNFHDDTAFCIFLLHIKLETICYETFGAFTVQISHKGTRGPLSASSAWYCPSFQAILVSCCWYADEIRFFPLEKIFSNVDQTPPVAKWFQH